MDNILEVLKQLGAARVAIMGFVLVGLLIFFVFVSMRLSSPDMSLLYDDLSSMDSSAIAAKLEESSIPFKVSPDATRVTVPENEVGRARMLLAAEGLPNGGSMGYEVFDNQSGFGTTTFVQNINQVRALEGELARTISSLHSIRSARIHLVLPQRELFGRDSRQASASVFIAHTPGQRLQPGQIVAIQSLVASAVPELSAGRVSLIDSQGNLLARGDEGGGNLMTVKSEEMRRNYEDRLTQTIEDIVSRIVGFGGVRANVTADLNFDRIQTNEEIYDPASQVARSTQTTEESGLERNPPASDVSIQNNLPGVAGDLLGGSKPVSESNRVEEVTNFEISKTVRSLVREIGEVKKLSVAVVVDGTYIQPEDPEAEEIYEPRTQEELDKIASIVKSAIGYDESRGDTLEVVNMPFAKVDAGRKSPSAELLLGFERDDLLDAVEILSVVIMIILVILLVVQPMVSRLLTPRAPTMDEAMEADLLAGRNPSAALAAPDAEKFEAPEENDEMYEEEEEDNLIDMQRVKGKVKASSVKKVEDIVANYPNETVSVLRNWMSSES